MYLAYSTGEPLTKFPDRSILLSPSYFREVFRNVKNFICVHSLSHNKMNAKLFKSAVNTSSLKRSLDTSKCNKSNWLFFKKNIYWINYKLNLNKLIMILKYSSKWYFSIKNIFKQWFKKFEIREKTNAKLNRKTQQTPN